MRIALAEAERPIERDDDVPLLAAALRRLGAEVETPGWSDPAIGWGEFDLVVVKSTWDYHERPEAFRRWLRAVDAATRLVNPLRTILWNLDKRYLRELAGAGVPTIETIWSEPGSEDGVATEVADRGWDEAIVKPAVDLGAMRLARVDPGRVAEILRRLGEPALVQPFLPAVEEQGELSIVHFAGSAAYALRKRPASGDFRVQPLYGGTHERVEAPAAALEIAATALAAAPGEPLYARVDLLAAPDGSLRLIELELIEPAYYLDVQPAAAELVARLLLRAGVGGSRGGGRPGPRRLSAR